MDNKINNLISCSDRSKKRGSNQRVLATKAEFYQLIHLQHNWSIFNKLSINKGSFVWRRVVMVGIWIVSSDLWCGSNANFPTQGRGWQCSPTTEQNETILLWYTCNRCKWRPSVVENPNFSVKSPPNNLFNWHYLLILFLTVRLHSGRCVCLEHV